jgi:hypothetical protein
MHDRNDFRLLHDAWLLWYHRWGARQSHAGILVLEQYERQLAWEIAGVITALVGTCCVSLEGDLYEWRRSTGWARFPD